MHEKNLICDIDVDRSLIDLEKQMNPEMDTAMDNFDAVKGNINFIGHVTAAHPDNLVGSLLKPMIELDEGTRRDVPHYNELHISNFVYAGPSIVKLTKFHFHHYGRTNWYKIQNGTRVYYYLISSENEKYSDFKQVGLRIINRDNEEVIIPDPNFKLMAKAYQIHVKPDICIECIFNGNNMSCSTMKVIRMNGDMQTTVNENVNVIWQ